MRTRRMVLVAPAILALTLGFSVGTVAQEEPVINPVAASIAVEQLPGGTFGVADRVFQYRSFQMAGPVVADDHRLTGDLTAVLNWDVLAAGGAPMPSWGTMTIDVTDTFLGGPLVGSTYEVGTWSGSMSGFQRHDLTPLELSAFLIGEGEFEGLCVTVDIDATGKTGGGTWTMDGVIHPLPVLATG